MNYEPTALPHYFETKVLKIELHYDREIRNFRKSIFFEKIGSEPAISCFQGVLKRQITPEEFEKMINYKILFK